MKVKKPSRTKKTKPSRPTTKTKETLVEKPLRTHPSQTKLWVSVIIVMVAIVIIWIYSLQFTLQQPGAALQNSVQDAQLDDLVKDIQKGFTDLQHTADQITTTNTNTSSPTPANSNEDLNNLFSDIH